MSLLREGKQRQEREATALADGALQRLTGCPERRSTDELEIEHRAGG